MRLKIILLNLILLPFIVNAQYTFTDVLTNVPFPIAMDLDNDGNIYLTLKGGVGGTADSGVVNVYDPAGTYLGQVCDLTDSVSVNGEQGVLGVTLDPLFSSNQYVYVYYNHKTPKKIRVMRYTMSGFSGTNPQVILDIDDSNTATNHVGGNIHFRPSEPDKLYIALGERAIPNNAQLLTNPWGKILRINSDGTIPADNPYYDDGDPLAGNDDRIWSYGHRNPFDFTFGPNDSLYCSENGQYDLDEVNLITRAGNYGWPDCEGTQNYNGSCATPGLLAPLEVFSPVPGGLPAVTGTMYYTGSVMPEFDNHLLVVTYTDGSVRDLTLSNAPGYDTVTTSQTLFSGQFDGLTDIKQSPDGCIYVVDGGYSANGAVIKVCPDGMGISDPSTFQVRLYPNPATDVVTVLTDKTIDVIRITDVNGRLVLDQRSTGNKIDVSTLEPGLYSVELFSGQVRLTGRFVKR